MNTLETIKIDGAAAMDKLKSGATLTSSERAVMNIYMSMFAKKAGNAGKRKVIATGR